MDTAMQSKVLKYAQNIRPLPTVKRLTQAKPASGSAPRTALTQYSTYLFTDKDPVIDLLRTQIQKIGMTQVELSLRSGVSQSTIKGWFSGATRRPQFATCQAVARALGLDFQLSARQATH